MLNKKPYLKEIILNHDLISSYREYPFNIPIIKTLNSLEFHKDVTFIIGENGTGKSTLIESIALSLGFGIEGGTRNVQIKTHNNASSLFQHLKLIKSFQKPSDYYFLRAESFYNVATYMEETNYLKGYGGISLHNLSHGESFMAALTNKLKGKGLYIFDEPEAALSPTRQMSALVAIDQLVKADSQFIIATHSPILLAYPSSMIYQLDSNGIKEVKYEDTEHYIITKRFLNDPQRMIEILLKEETIHNKK
ncbi:MAG: AAA family ATPase [Jejuia sp.]